MIVFAVEVLHMWPGLAGLFMSGVFAASLSTISSGLNSLSAVVLQDFVKAMWPNWLSATSEALFVKLLALAFGAVTIALAILVSMLGGQMLQLNVTAVSVTQGPLLGVFSLGILFPWPMGRSALFGLIFSSTVAVFVVAGSQLSGIREATPVRGISECLLEGENASDFLSALGSGDELAAKDSTDGVFLLFRLSYMLFTAFSALLCIVSSLIYASLSPGDWRCASLANQCLHYPLFYRLAFFLPERFRKVLQFGIDYRVAGENSAEVRTDQAQMRHGFGASDTTSTLLARVPEDLLEMDSYERSDLTGSQ